MYLLHADGSTTDLNVPKSTKVPNGGKGIMDGLAVRRGYLVVRRATSLETNLGADVVVAVFETEQAAEAWVRQLMEGKVCVKDAGGSTSSPTSGNGKRRVTDARATGRNGTGSRG